MSTESVTIKLEAADAGAKALLDQVIQRIDKLNASSDKGTETTKKSGKAAKEASEGFKALSETINRITEFVAGAALVELVNQSIEGAAKLHTLAEETGISVEALSVFKYAAEQAGLGAEDFTGAMRGLSKSLTELRAGTPAAVEAFNAIGLSAKDVADLPLDEVLKTVATRMSAYADGAGKAAVAQQIFGRSGFQILTLLKELAGDGFDKAADSAEKFHAKLTAEEVQQAEEYEKAMGRLSASVHGLTLELVGPLIPKLTELNNELARADGSSGFEKGLEAFAKSLPFIGRAVELQQAYNDALAEQRKLQDFALEQQKRIQQSNRDNEGDHLGAIGLPPVVLADVAAQKAALAARIAALQQEAQAVSANTKNQEQLNQAAFDKGLESLHAYYAKRREIFNTENAREVSILERTRAAIASQQPTVPAEQIAQKQQLDAIDSQIHVKRIQRAGENAQLTEEERKDQKKLADDIVAFQASILSAEGKTLEAAILGINKKIEADTLLLEKQGKISAAAQQQLDTERRLLTQRAQFDDLSRQSDRAFGDLARERAEIEQQATNGLISQRDAEHQIAELELSRVPALKEMAAQMLAFAQSIGDPALIASAQNLSSSIGTLGIEKSTKAAAVAMANFRDTAIRALGNDLGDFLGSGINQINSMSGAFRSLASSAVASIQQIIAQMIALRVIAFGTGLFASAGAALGPSVGNSVGATGGGIPGLGPMPLLPSGSLSVTPLAVRDFSASGLSSFAGAPRASVGPGGTGDPFELHLTLDEGLVLAKMKSPEGAKIHVTHTANNKNAIKAVLG